MNKEYFRLYDLICTPEYFRKSEERMKTLIYDIMNFIASEKESKRDKFVGLICKEESG